MKNIVLILLSFWATVCVAQDAILSNKPLAEQQIMQLHSGTLVVRLKTYGRSVDAYRASGKTNLADKLEKNYRVINLFLIKAFVENVNFCKVLFIKADDSRKLIAHQPNIFLNEKLQVDSSIPPPTGPVFLVEFGELMSNDRTSDKSFVVKNTEATASTGSSSAIVISDTTFTQLKEPFPFYTVVGTMDEALPAIAPGINGAPVDTNAWHMENSSNEKPKGRVNPIWKKDIYERAVKRLNKELIGYYCKVSKKSGVNISDDLLDWEHKNPNGNTDARLKLIVEEITKLQDAQFQPQK